MPLTESELRSLHYQAFQEVIDLYKETATTNGSSPAFNYAQMGCGGGAQNSRVVKPSDSDFTCDVELAINYVIPEPDVRKLFNEAYLLDLSDVPLTQAEKSEIEEKIGTAFVKRRIFPLTQYFRGKFVTAKETP